MIFYISLCSYPHTSQSMGKLYLFVLVSNSMEVVQSKGKRVVAGFEISAFQSWDILSATVPQRQWSSIKLCTNIFFRFCNDVIRWCCLIQQELSLSFYIPKRILSCKMRYFKLSLSLLFLYFHPFFCVSIHSPSTFKKTILPSLLEDTHLLLLFLQRNLRLVLRPIL